MEIRSQERSVDGVTILAVEREARGSMESVLKDRIDQLLSEGKVQIVLDLKQVAFIDSRDIGLIVRAHMAARHAGGSVRLCNLSARVLSALKITRLNTVLDLFPSEAEAIAGMKAPEANAAQKK
jgi:anti-sigma B factor antagonist